MTDNEQRCPEHRIRDCAPLLNGCSWRPGAAAVTPPAQDGLAFRSGADREGDGWLHDTVPAAPSVSTDHTDIGELRELAEAATPGPWKWSVSVDRQWALVETAEDNLRILAQLPDDDDAAFIAAASPDVILALVAELVGLRTEVDQLRTDNERLTACCNAHQRDVDEWAAEQAEASRKSLALMDDIADLRERLEVSASLSTYPVAEAMNQAERLAQYLESEGLAVRVPVVDDALLAERDALQARIDAALVIAWTEWGHLGDPYDRILAALGVDPQKETQR